MTGQQAYPAKRQGGWAAVSHPLNGHVRQTLAMGHVQGVEEGYSAQPRAILQGRVQCEQPTPTVDGEWGGGQACERVSSRLETRTPAGSALGVITVTWQGHWEVKQAKPQAHIWRISHYHRWWCSLCSPSPAWGRRKKQREEGEDMVGVTDLWLRLPSSYLD